MKGRWGLCTIAVARGEGEAGRNEKGRVIEGASEVDAKLKGEGEWKIEGKGVGVGVVGELEVGITGEGKYKGRSWGPLATMAKGIREKSRGRGGSLREGEGSCAPHLRV